MEFEVRNVETPVSLPIGSLVEESFVITNVIDPNGQHRLIVGSTPGMKTSNIIGMLQMAHDHMRGVAARAW